MSRPANTDVNWAKFSEEVPEPLLSAAQDDPPSSQADTLRTCSLHPGFITQDQACPMCLMAVGLEHPDIRIPKKLDRPNISPEADWTPNHGDQVAGYQILQKIAEGGMGEVYLAYQARLDRFVALKFLTTRRPSTPDFEERFIREAKALAGLKHPSIVSIYEVSEWNGKPFFSMEFIEGQDLSQVLEKEQLLLPRAVRLLLEIAKAVQFAHDRWVLHRDIKPSNVLIDLEDKPHLSDFGLATKMEVLTDLTLTGNIIGSPQYLSPEQAAGKSHEVSAASDIFALGILLYECLTNCVPFNGVNLQDTLRRIQEDSPVLPSEIRIEIPSDLEYICMRCLEKHPKNRYPSASALAHDLEAWLNQQPITQLKQYGLESIPSKWSFRNPFLPWTLFVITLMMLIVLGIAYMRLLKSLPHSSLKADPQETRVY